MVKVNFIKIENCYRYMHGKAVHGKLTTLVSIKGKDYYEKFRSISFVDKKQVGHQY